MPPATPTAPSLTKSCPAALRLTSTVLGWLSPITDKVPAEKVAVVAALAVAVEASVATIATAAMVRNRVMER